MLTLALLMTAAPADDLHALFDREWERWMKESPTWASSLGDRRYNDAWPDMSLAARDRIALEDSDALAALKKIDQSKLDDADRLNAAVFADVLETRIGMHKYKLDLAALDQIGGVHNQ